MKRDQRADGRTSRGATGLALFSLGLGSAQVGTPGAVARLVGADDGPTSRGVLRWACGVRELAVGLGAGFSASPGSWLWARVAGDAVDLALLTAVLGRNAARSRRGRSIRTLGALAAVLSVTAADVATARRASADDVEPGQVAAQLEARTSVTVNRPVSEVFAFWHDLENLPRFMTHLVSVTTTGPGRSTWTAKAPSGEVTWEAEMTEDVVDELIAWRSLPGADVPNTDRVRFAAAPGHRGTEVHVQLRYQPPAGRLGATVAKLFGEDPTQQVRDDLRRFKQVLETGEVVRTEGSPDGTSVSRQLRQRPAQPVSS